MARRINKKIKTEAGFVLLEMLTAVLIFSFIMTAAISVFIASYKAQNNAAGFQKDIENIRVSVESMAKNIRTSTLDYSNTDPEGTASEIYIYDYSQDKCIGYRFENTASGKKMLSSVENQIVRVDNDGNLVNCNVLSGESFTPLLAETEINKGKFLIKNTTALEMGKITIIMQLTENSEPFETSVSLRDY